MDPGTKIAVERVDSALLAVIYGQGDLETSLARILARQHLRVLRLRDATDALSVLEKPSYIFFFTSEEGSTSRLEVQFEEALQSASRLGAKLILVLHNASQSQEKILAGTLEKSGWPVATAEIKGWIENENKEALEAAASKIARLAFASHQKDKVIILGKEKLPAAGNEAPLKSLSVQDVFDRLNRYQRKKTLPFNRLKWLVVWVVLLICLASPILLLGAPGLTAYFHLQGTRENLTRGRFDQAGQAARAAKDDLRFGKTVVTSLSLGPISTLPFWEKYFQFLTLGETTADIMERAAVIGPQVQGFAQGMATGGDLEDDQTESIHRELAAIDSDLGLIEAQVGDLATGQTGKILSFFGFPVEKIASLGNQIPEVRDTLLRADKILAVWPEIVPSEGRRTYLIVFQNSTELRPTGGFIGSYGLVRFNQGRLLDWKILDIYSADGQLKGQISPPDELLHFLNQPSWYMRDSNWSPDWPLSAKRLLWFLEKETGERADGVIAVNLGAVQKLLAATGPLALADLKQTVSANDFFQRAEYAAEIDFFAGSTQKRDFLGSVAKALLTKITAGSGPNWPVFGQALASALNEKDILLFFNSPQAQQAAVESGWSGTINTSECQKIDGNCLALVDANLGLNKANYFISRRFQVSSAIGKGGNLDTTVMVQYQNNSPSNTWPGGTYKNYLRFLVPAGSKLVGFDLGDGRKPAISPVLTASQLQKLGSDQFLVFQTNEGSFTSFGALMELPIQTEQVVTFRYEPPYKVVFGQTQTPFAFNFLKQPGTGADNLDFVLEFPSFLSPEKSSSLDGRSPLVFPEKLIYNSDLATDRNIKVIFKNNLAN